MSRKNLSHKSLKIIFFITSLTISSVSVSAQADKLSITSNPYRYSDQYTDTESHLQYLDARYYDASVMRFVSRDSVKLLNRYNYADGNPIGNNDPSGHDSGQVLGNISDSISIALNTVFTAYTIKKAWELPDFLSVRPSFWQRLGMLKSTGTGSLIFSGAMNIVASAIDIKSNSTENQDLSNVLNQSIIYGFAPSWAVSSLVFDTFSVYKARIYNTPIWPGVSAGLLTLTAFSMQLALAIDNKQHTISDANSEALGYIATIIAITSMLPRAVALQYAPLTESFAENEELEIGNRVVGQGRGLSAIAGRPNELTLPFLLNVRN